MAEETLTIFTPTFNRAYCLGQLYDSLLRQTSKNFCWLIVDDGSTDNTKELVLSWQKEGKVPIEYHWQKNRGKMRAHNYGVTLTQTELFMCCDSDDYLTDDAVEKICRAWASYMEPRESISGIMGPRCVYKGTVKMENSLPLQNEAMTLWDFTHRRGHVKETFLVFVTEIIRQYPFPVQPGETFIPEGYTYNQLDDYYKMIPLKEELMICHYLSDGYTLGDGLKRMKNNPKGCAMAKNETVRRQPWGRKKLSAARDYVALSMIGGGNMIDAIIKSSSPLASFLMLPWAVKRYIQLNFSKKH